MTAQVTPVVHVLVRGEKDPPSPEDPDCPRARRDDGLVDRFCAWLQDEKIVSFSGTSVGQALYSAFFWPKDIPAIEAWLMQNNCHLNPSTESST